MRQSVFGPGSKILTFNGYYAIEHIPEECRGVDNGDVTIGDDAFICANCTILPCVTIGDVATIDAHRFVNKDLEPWVIYVGLLCHKIGERQKPTEERQKRILEVDWSNHL